MNTVRLRKTSTVILLAFWIGAYLCHANAETPEQEPTNRRCSSISGKYLFKGKGASEGESRSLFYVLWGAPSLLGDPTEVELIQDVDQDTLQIKMYGKHFLRSEPRADGLLKLRCAAKKSVYEYSGEGYSEAHNKWHYVFEFIKDIDGSLIVHATYKKEVERFPFIWDKDRLEQTTRFLPAPPMAN